MSEFRRYVDRVITSRLTRVAVCVGIVAAACGEKDFKGSTTLAERVPVYAGPIQGGDVPFKYADPDITPFTPECRVISAGLGVDSIKVEIYIKGQGYPDRGYISDRNLPKVSDTPELSLSECEA